MPGLKQPRNKGLANIDEIMALREETEERQESSPAAEEDINHININGAAKLYSRNFSAIGNVLRRKYEDGNPPRLHKQFYHAIVKAMAGKTRDMVILAPILKELEIGRASAIKMLSCFEEYGYMRFKRATNERGRLLIIEILKQMKH